MTFKSCHHIFCLIIAIQHDRDKIRYTKRLKKKDQKSYASQDIHDGKALREKGEYSPQSILYEFFFFNFLMWLHFNRVFHSLHPHMFSSLDDATASPSSSFAGQSLGSASGETYLDYDMQDVQVS